MTERKISVLIAEDDDEARNALKALLVSQGYRADAVTDGAAALERITEAPPDIVVTDLHMPKLDGIELLKELKAKRSQVPVIVLTSSHEISSAVAAMREGAVDFLTKPVDADVLAIAIERAIENRNVRYEAENLSRQLNEKYSESLVGLLGNSPAMQAVYRTARQVAPTRATILITGESGTGKGELARAIHTLGGRAEKPFVSVHCAALAETLLESELFGHEKGSFTGAERRRVGRFEQANGGTLFLDEIGEISPSIQVKLLNVLQERRVERVGGNESVPIDVRIVAATNRNLADDVKAGRFREDLFYRLNVVQIEMPPLRMRGADTLILAEHFLRKFCLENHKSIEGFTDRARSKIRNHRWPGNVRALENAMERAVVLCDGERIDDEHLPFESVSAPTFDGLQVPGATMAEVERHVLLKTLDAVDGSTTRAAEILDVGVRTIQYRLHQYGLTKNRSDKSE